MHRVLAVLLALLAPSIALAQEPPRLALTTAGQGSAFLPYGEGLARVVNAGTAARLDVRQTGGSIDNLRAVHADATVLGTAFLGSVHEAVSGTRFAQGAALGNIVALFPMYETAFMAAALRPSGLTAIASLDGKRVGVGPARGPAEGYFRAVAEIARITPVIVNGQPADLARQLIAGEIDALWQGAVVPVPSLVAVANGADAVVFGLSEAEVAAMRQRFPFMSPVTVPAATYRGQTAPLASVAAWNFVVGHKDLPEPVAYALTRAVLTAPNLVDVVGSSANGTRAANASTNTVVPFHPGAARALRELGARLP